ncbi:MAG: histidinol-phosphate transaminase [Bacteroidota bacterium]|nr:histidinol-phosphate transaminase [Bacteroidota bacterium]MDP4190426.1 histidinol-phosphate transaminase [Bacteroidota bacterium]MDP4194565.1 histidinol-phosphate transaminase [Bacteroidota bacterium]
MKIEDLVRKNILALKPYTCARDIYSDGILLDANENSLGSTAEGFDSLQLNRYPDPHQVDLKQAVGKYLSVDAKNLFFGVGSDEIIDLLIRIFCNPAKDAIMILDPTYGMYKVAADVNDVESISVNLDENFQIDFQAVQNSYKDNVKIIFTCSPNNPTGNLIRKQDLLKLCNDYNSIVVVDEAYVDFSGDNSLIGEVNNYPNLVILRTFSKAWGLAGVRLGFTIANESIISFLFKIKAPYNVNSLTRSAVLNAIANFEQKKSFVEQLVLERERIISELKKVPGVEKVYRSDANYLLFKCKRASEVQKNMAESGIVIRDRSSYDMLDNCLRVSVGTVDENNKFLDLLKKELCTK